MVQVESAPFGRRRFQAHDQRMKSGTLRRTLAKMTEAGYVTVEGSAEYVYPTVPAFLHQQPELTAKAATSILKRVHRRG